MAAIEVQTPFGHPIPPAPGHSPEYSVTTHIPAWETVALFSAKVIGNLTASCTEFPANPLAGSQAVRETHEPVSSVQAESGCRSSMSPCEAEVSQICLTFTTARSPHHESIRT